MNRTAWLICIIASIGFAFDIYELLMLPLIVRPALQTLIPGISLTSPEYISWARTLFFVPAIVGGVFGMLGGYLTDRLGRRRVLTFSILLYAFSAFAAGFATTPHQLLFFRCLVFIGVCVEFVAAVAWLAELFQNPEQREKVLGYTQAFSSFGGLLVSAAYLLIAKNVDSLPAIHGGHEAWRYTLISGVIPAIPLILIRPFLPESPIWAKKKEAGTLRRPSIGQLFTPQLARTTVVTTIMFACSYGAAFGAIQQLPQIVPGLPGVRDLPKPQQAEVVGQVQLVQEIGGLVGRFVLAVLAVKILSRRKLIRVFQIPGLILVPWVFFYPATSDLEMLKIGIFFAGLLTVAQFSFWGNYLPRVYPVHLRGTGESFAANIGGRIFGTAFAWVTLTIAGSAWLKNMLPQATAPVKFAYTAAGVAFAVYLVGLICSAFLPEPPAEEEHH
ncbi:MAG TPA: MFS transporter [Methylomirabilota bacterium]|nr:MFS transporter [Methylomirabilota bacterium]